MIDLTTEMALEMMEGQLPPTEPGNARDCYYKLLLHRFEQEHGKPAAKELWLIAGVPPGLWAWMKAVAWRNTLKLHSSG